jgi:hypothetical protein
MTTALLVVKSDVKSDLMPIFVSYPITANPVAPRASAKSMCVLA